MKSKRIKRNADAVTAAYVRAARSFERWFARLQTAVARCQAERDVMKRAVKIAEEMGFAGLLDLQVETAAGTKDKLSDQDHPNRPGGNARGAGDGQ